MLRLSLCSGTCLSATSSGTSSLHRRSLFVGQAASRPGTGFGVPSSDPFTGKSKLFQARLAVTAVPAGTILAGAADLLPPSAQLQGKAVKAKWNAVSLAFLGDSVWEVCITTSSVFRACLQHVVTWLPLLMHSPCQSGTRWRNQFAVACT